MSHLQDTSISLDLCLSDIPKERIRKCNDGKLRIYITVRPRKEPDRFDNDVTAFCSLTKEEREADMPKIYVGAGRSFKFSGNPADGMGQPSQEDFDDLPF